MATASTSQADMAAGGGIGFCVTGNQIMGLPPCFKTKSGKPVTPAAWIITLTPAVPGPGTTVTATAINSQGDPYLSITVTIPIAVDPTGGGVLGTVGDIATALGSGGADITGSVSWPVIPYPGGSPVVKPMGGTDVAIQYLTQVLQWAQQSGRLCQTPEKFKQLSTKVTTQAHVFAGLLDDAMPPAMVAPDDDAAVSPDDDTGLVPDDSCGPECGCFTPPEENRSDYQSGALPIDDSAVPYTF